MCVVVCVCVSVCMFVVVSWHTQRCKFMAPVMFVCGWLNHQRQPQRQQRTLAAASAKAVFNEIFSFAARQAQRSQLRAEQAESRQKQSSSRDRARGRERPQRRQARNIVEGLLKATGGELCHNYK